jgi:CDP-archaeol synthase
MPAPLDPLSCAVFVILAFVPAAVAHALWLRSRWSAPWRIPIDHGLTWRGRRLFGANKTWAGFLVLPVAVGAFFALLRLGANGLSRTWSEGLWPLSVGGYALFGWWTGFGFMAGELPNSFVKRQFDIEPGRTPAGRSARVVCFLIDRLDSFAGAYVAQSLVVSTGFWYPVYVLLVAPGLHWLFSVLLFSLGVKGRPS